MSDYQTGFTRHWLGELLSALDAEVDAAQRARILARCAHSCTDHWAGVAGEVRRSLGDSADVDALLDAFAGRLPGGADLARRNGEIRWRFTGPSCPCPVAQFVAHPAICDCSVAHVRGMLEPLLGRPLEVELLRSRLRGAEDCLFVARL